MISFQAIAAPLRIQPAAPPLTDPAEIDRRFGYWRRRVMYSAVAGYALLLFGARQHLDRDRCHHG